MTDGGLTRFANIVRTGILAILLLGWFILGFAIYRAGLLLPVMTFCSTWVFVWLVVIKGKRLR